MGNTHSDKNNNFTMLLLLLIIILIVAVYCVIKADIKDLQIQIDNAIHERAELIKKTQILEEKIIKDEFWIEYLLNNSINKTDLKKELETRKVPIPENKASYYIPNVNGEIEKNNLKYMDNIQCYDSEFILEYISIENNIDTHLIIVNAISNLSDDICKNCKTDTEKATAIAKWVSDNIYYNDYAAATEITPDVISLETVLALRRTTCAGYSNLFSALCQAQGIYCINIRGGASEVEDINTIPTNHEWNGALCDGEWLFYDTTWASSNNYVNNEYCSGLTEERYFEMSFSEMSQCRRIDKLDFRDFFTAINS